MRRYAADGSALLALLLCSVLLHWNGLLGGPTYYEHDTHVFYFPLAQAVAEHLQRGVFPLWLPDIFTGYPIFADGEMGLLYLPHLLLLTALPTPLAMVVSRALHAFLAGAFMYLFLRGSVRLLPLPSLGGALVFAFGSYLSTQMHHENVVRSAVWLPLVLLLADRALQTRERRRAWGWLALAALAYAQSALGLHVQPTLMLALALGGFGLFRWAWPGVRPVVEPAGSGGGGAGARLWRASARLRWHAWVVLGTVGGGLALAAAQWGPLLEWARTSFRGGGVSYEFASAFGLATENLPALLLPYLFRHPDGHTWWTLWQPWEILLYAGIPTLALGLVGLVAARRREALFFGALGVVSLLVAMTHYAPILNLHETLWSLPGFSFLRAPGRFVYLVVFALGGLAALGLQALSERSGWRGRLLVVLLGAVPAVALLAALLALLPNWRGWLAADETRGLQYIQETYLSVRAQYAIEPRVIYESLQAGFDLTHPKTAWVLVLLAATAALVVAWVALRPGRAWWAQAGLVSLLAADLLVFAADFHPRGPLSGFTAVAPAGVETGSRAFVLDARANGLAEWEPNLPVTQGVRQADGYSSLPSQRHFDLFGHSQVDPSLIPLWGAERVVVPTWPADGREAQGVRFRTEHPLVLGFGGSGAAIFRGAGRFVAGVRVVGTLSYAFEVPQGETVATVTLLDGQGGRVVVPIRAGVEMAERAIDRPSLEPLLQHEKPAGENALAYSFAESSPTGEDYVAHLYYAEVGLPDPMVVERVEVTPVHAQALAQVHGLALVGADGAVRNLGLGEREGWHLVEAADRWTVLQPPDRSARATVWPRASGVDRAGQPELTPVQIMTSAGFDPARHLLLEGVASGEVAARPDGAVGGEPRPARVEDQGPNRVVIQAEADGPGYLVLSDHFHRGWRAWVDGEPAPVHIANAVFRAVPIESGVHTVAMRFEPLTHVAGAIISVVALITALGVAAWGFSGRRRAG